MTYTGDTWCIEMSGQSNRAYPGRGEVYTNAAVKAWWFNPTDSNASSGNQWVDLEGNTSRHGGSAASMVRRLIELGIPAAKIRLLEFTYGSSAMNRWDPNGIYLPVKDIMANRALALQSLRATCPAGERIRFLHHRDQGTTDMQVDNPTYQDGWAAATDLYHNALVAQNILYGFEPHVAKLANMCFSGLDVSFHDPKIRRQNLVWVGGTPDADTTKVGSHPRLIKTEDARIYDADGTHRRAAPIDIDGKTYAGGGYHYVGEVLEAPAIFGIINMGNIPLYTRNITANQLRNQQAAPIAATHYVHLYGASSVPLTAGNAPGYAAVSFTNNQVSWPDAVGVVKSNGIAWTWTPSGTTGLAIEEIRVTDSATEGQGDIIAQDTFSPIAWTNANGNLSIAPGGFTVTFASAVLNGGPSAAAVQPVINRILGGVSNSPPTTVHACWFNGDPANGGSQVGARVAVTLASSWGAANNGACVNTAAVSLPHQGLGTYYAEYDATSGGSLLSSTLRASQLGADGVIPAGSLVLQVT